MSPLLSIIVPTKNRYYYLSYLVDYFCTIKKPNIELVIQDNSNDLSDRSAFLQKLKTYNDKRIKYNFESKELSVIENSDFALLAATGEYICYIGDDDIFSKYLLTYLEKMKALNIDAILPIKSSYNWPDIHSRLYGNKLSGKFSSKTFTGEETEVNCKEVLNELLSNGGIDILNLPRVYHGIINHKLLKEIYKRTGSYFPGPSPDMANATALSIVVDKMIEVDIPFVISGHSVKSGGGMGASGKHIGEISNYKHLPQNTADLWNKEVPFYWSGFTIYAESVLQALSRLKKEDLIERFNFNYLYATCLVYDSLYSDRIKKVIKNTQKDNKNISNLLIGVYFVKIWQKRILHHLKNNLLVMLGSQKRIKVFECENILDVATINDAMIEKEILDKLKK